MLRIDADGRVVHPGIKWQRFTNLERGDLDPVAGIIVHQTGSSTAASTLAAYKTALHGAHFLIDKDGTVYQTASLLKRTNHVGRLRSRCVAEHRCAPGEEKRISAMDPRARNTHEMTKSVPDRYPSNSNSIGIELVGMASPPPPGKMDGVYEAVTAKQNHNLTWLVRELSATLDVRMTEVFRHPVVSQKNPTEAASARW
jgi:N-acetyl-anhydromuramyl-L-alanine amidase AmpD